MIELLCLVAGIFIGYSWAPKPQRGNRPVHLTTQPLTDWWDE